MLKIFPKYLNFDNISKKCIRVPGPEGILSFIKDGIITNISIVKAFRFLLTYLTLS